MRQRKPTSVPHLALLWSIIPMVLLTFACGGDEATPTVGYAGICEAMTRAKDGDLERAALVFDHGPLHELAAELLETDRSVAARLLEAKQRVEATLLSRFGASGDALAALEALATATRDAQRAAGEPVLGPCEGER